MGIEVIVGLASLAVGAIGTAVQVGAQRRAARDARRAQEEARDIQTAQGQVEQRESQRQAIREQRVRRARIQQAAENQGVSGSAGELGALGALGTNLGTQSSLAQGRTLASQGISQQNQIAANAIQQGRTTAATAGAVTSLFQTAFQVGGQLFA